MADLLIAIVGDISPERNYQPPSKNGASAKKAAEQLGAELAKQGARLLVYGGPFLETDVVRGYVGANPKNDNSITMWYTSGNQPAPFPEEASRPKLFKRISQQGVDWEVAFYRSITRADGIILMGGDNAVKISGQVAIGIRMPIIALSEFGGGAARVWESLSAGEDLPTREDIDVMARPWTDGSAAACVQSLFRQYERKQAASVNLDPRWTIVGAVLFIIALSSVPWVFGHQKFEVFMLFLIPLLAGGSGAVIRQLVNPRGTVTLATFVMGLVAGGIAGVLFVTAQLTGNPNLGLPEQLVKYATSSIPYALGVGFIAGLTSDAVFGKLLKLDVVKTKGIDAGGGI